jgi:DNA-binding NtrC family response regulator
MKIARIKMSNKDLNILHSFNVLYLEDDENLLKHTRDILEDFVNNIYAVKTSTEALDVLLHKKVDVIICDILLKDENGIDFLKHIKNKNINIPTILTTAHTDTQYLLDAIKLKVENYIVKPINIKELLNSLHDILLPIIQHKEIQKNNNLIKTISAITDGKQVEIIKYILNNLDNENLFIASYTDIMENFSISKPTLIKLFKDLAEKNILVKVQHKTYRFDEQALDNI